MLRMLTVFIAFFSATVAAKCYDQNVAHHKCRHPSGDEWCKMHSKAHYAYLDSCEPISFKPQEHSDTLPESGQSSPSNGSINGWFSVGDVGDGICQISLQSMSGPTQNYYCSNVWLSDEAKAQGETLNDSGILRTWDPSKLVTYGKTYTVTSDPGPYYGEKTWYDSTVRYSPVVVNGVTVDGALRGTGRVCTGAVPTPSGAQCAQYRQSTNFLVRDWNMAINIIKEIQNQKKSQRDQAVKLFGTMLKGLLN